MVSKPNLGSTLSVRSSSNFQKLKLPMAILLAVTGISSAYAQVPADSNLEEIQVTGSRIRVTNGMETPNPVTVVTVEEISLLAPGSLGDGLAVLPQFYNSTTTNSAATGFFSNPTTGALNLRGLQSKRTLTLLNGRRVISSTINSGPDNNFFPAAMMKSVETVTGGASAAYGTDAVSGVVNFILDTKFTGYKASIQGGENYNADNKNYQVSLAGGWNLGEKTHLLLSIEKYHQDAVRGRDDYDWFKGAGLLTNPSVDAGKTPENPVRLPFNNIVSRTASYDGVVVFPTTGANLGNWLVDPTGKTACKMTPGANFDTNFTTDAPGCTGINNGADLAELQPETGRQNLFGYLDYDVTDNLTVFGQLIYGNVDETSRGNRGLFGGGNGSTGRAFTIYSGNPYLPVNIQQLMTANNIPSVAVNRIGYSSDLAIGYNTSDNEVGSLTTGFNLKINNGGFFDGWAVDGYVQHGRSKSVNSQDNGIRLDRVYTAADAVTDASGKIVCNVTKVSGKDTGCVPLNIFGRGQASAAAVDWVTGFDPGVQVSTNGWLADGRTIPYEYVGGSAKVRTTKLRQDAFELAANGDIYKGFGAGPISMAIGYDWRQESYVQLIQAPQGGNAAANINTAPGKGIYPVPANNLALGIRGIPTQDITNTSEIQFSKVAFGIGAYKVREAFTEFNIPLLADAPFIKELSANLAARWAKYDGSGDIWSWKGGLQWRINEQIRLRGTVSQDVRAANLGERFDRSGGAGTAIDYLEDPTGGAAAQYPINVVTGGNPKVKPEVAKTYTAGIVYQPQWLDGLQMSADWYNVDIHNNINQLGVTAILNNCYKNNDVDACAFIERNGAPSPLVPGLNRISLINNVFFNINSTEAEGIDLEMSYRTDIQVFGGGESLRLRFLGSKLLSNTTTNSVGVVTRLDGLNNGANILPQWSNQFSTTYDRGPFSISLIARFESATTQSYTNNIYQSSLGRVRYDVLNNSVPSLTLWDSSVRYNFDVKDGHKVSTFLTVNNLLNEDPRELLGTPDASGNGGAAVSNGVTGSLLGRRFTVGANFNF